MWPFLPSLFTAGSVDASLVFIELGVAVIGLAILARIAHRLGFSAVPLYLLAGLAFGNGGLLPLNFSQEFIQVGAEIGVLLLLFLLGLEYTGEELGRSLRTGLVAGIADFVLNFTPGLAAGLLWGWKPMGAVLLGGVTYISSSGIVARVLNELRWRKNPEISGVLSLLVIEDLAMAIYLPLVAVLLAGQSLVTGLFSVAGAMGTVGLVMFLAVRYGKTLSRVVWHKNDEVILLSTFGLMLLVAGIAQRLQVSAAIGAFLVGIAVSGPLVKQVHRLLEPLRDLFAGVFFLFFGLQIDPSTLPPVLFPALLLAVVTFLTKMATGWWMARRAGLDSAAGLRAGALLTARGEFSIIIAGLGVTAGITPQLGPLSAAYVLFLAIASPLFARFLPVKRPAAPLPTTQSEQAPTP